MSESGGTNASVCLAEQNAVMILFGWSHSTECVLFWTTFHWLLQHASQPKGAGGSLVGYIIWVYSKQISSSQVTKAAVRLLSGSTGKCLWLIVRYKMLNNSDSRAILTTLCIHIHRHCKIIKMWWFGGQDAGIRQPPLHAGLLHQSAMIVTFFVHQPFPCFA